MDIYCQFHYYRFKCKLFQVLFICSCLWHRQLCRGIDRRQTGHRINGVQIIAPIELGESYADCLREAGYGVTMLDGYGYNATRKVLMLYMPRKKLNSAMKKITEEMPEAVVVVSDLKKYVGDIVANN